MNWIFPCTNRFEWHSEIRKSIVQLGIDKYRPPWVKDW
jgi:hypothetical protein